MMVAVYFVFPLAFSAEPLPKDVNRFIYNAEACEHLAGEFDGELPKRQQDEILKNIHKHCKAAKNQLRILEMKYKGNAKIMKLIKSNAKEVLINSLSQRIWRTKQPIGEPLKPIFRSG